MKKYSKKIKSLFYLASIIIFVSLFSSFLVIYCIGYHPPILMYHEIKEDNSNSKLIVSPLHFRRQMEFLKSHHYHVLDLETFFKRVFSPLPMPSKMISLTFDDGFQSNYDYAFPILKKLNFPATIFLISSKIDKPHYLTRDQIQEMEHHNIRFGNHSKTHPSLTTIDKKQLLQEISDSQLYLNTFLKHPSLIFCYPSGHYNKEIENILKTQGYKAALSASPDGVAPLKNPYGFKRVRISNSSNHLIVFWFETSGYYSTIRHVQKKISKWEKKIGSFFKKKNCCF